MATPDRRTQILATAATLFAERGFHGVSLNDLGTAVGVSGPAIYKHFASKEALLSEMLINISEQLLSEGTRRIDRGEGLAGLIEWHTSFALGHKALIVVQDRDWSSLADDARERVRTLQRAYVELWAKEIKALHADLSITQAQARAHAVFGLLNSTPHSAFLPPVEMHQTLKEMASRALGNPK